MDSLARLNDLLAQIGASNPFQQRRVGQVRLGSLEELRGLPFTTKQELLADQAAHPPFGTNLTHSLERYTHLHQTSGTTGATLRVLDTPDDWRWWSRCLQRVFTEAGIVADDRIALAYSFGPYVQFWASYEGAQDLGAMVVALGGMDSVQRLVTIREYGATVVLCTPSYASHLAKTAQRNDLGDALDSVRCLVCTGEPGASLPAFRAEIEAAWGARCFDHAGLSEVGPIGYPCNADGGLHLMEDEFVCEILDPDTLEPAEPGAAGELVVTALGRIGFPVVRYRTGDILAPDAGPCSAGHPGRWLPTGVLGRTDDMVIIRGMNVFPSAIEQTLRESSGVGEFRITFYTDPRAMDEVKVEAELAEPSETRAIQARMRERLGLRVRLVPVKPGLLTTTVDKARRVEDLRTSAAGIGTPS